MKRFHYFIFYQYNNIYLPFSIGLKNACKTSLSGNFTRTTTFKDTLITKNTEETAMTRHPHLWGKIIPRVP